MGSGIILNASALRAHSGYLEWGDFLAQVRAACHPGEIIRLVAGSREVAVFCNFDKQVITGGGFTACVYVAGRTSSP